ncbi:MAG: protein-glutamate O-methyltransferase [Proteobacteria bacterium]|nr:protein-glutamate O-methyltransferase [Pseudomonadota bacterium]
MTGGPKAPATGARESSNEEFAFTSSDFMHLAEMLRSNTGIVLDDEKMPLVYARLTKRLRAHGFKTFRRYRAFISTEQGAGERRRMMEALTTNVTRFFREAHHFEHLKNRALPPLVAAARNGKRVRLWSAGCSTGEEAYSMALTLLSIMPDATRFDIKILATDIDTNVLDHARAGVYPAAAVSPVSAELRERWFVPNDANPDESFLRVRRDLKSLVAFRTANLIGPWPMKGPFQVIFCRNTVIYFDEITRNDIWNKMAALLAAGGHLYVGHSERLPADAHWFRPDGLTIYRREDDAFASPAHARSVRGD